MRRSEQWEEPDGAGPLEQLEQLEQLKLLERQDLALVSMEQRLAGSIWNTHLGTRCPLADGLLEEMQHVTTRQA